MQNTDHKYAFIVDTIEDDVFLMLESPISQMDRVASASYPWSHGKPIEAFRKPAVVAPSLLLAPGIHRVIDDFGPVISG